MADKRELEYSSIMQACLLQSDKLEKSELKSLWTVLHIRDKLIDDRKAIEDLSKQLVQFYLKQEAKKKPRDI